MSDMKCPVCKTGTVEQGKHDKEYFCDNEFCPSYDETDSKTYNILIRTRKALGIAVDALKEQQRWFGVIRVSLISHLNNEYGTLFKSYDADPTVVNVKRANDILNATIKKITAPEQKDVK